MSSKSVTMEKGMLEELLLVCTFVGTKKAGEDPTSSKKADEIGFVRGEDCVVREPFCSFVWCGGGGLLLLERPGASDRVVRPPPS